MENNIKLIKLRHLQRTKQPPLKKRGIKGDDSQICCWPSGVSC